MTNDIFSARRAMNTDIAELCLIAQSNKEFSFFNQATAHSITQGGEIWCCEQNKKIAAFGGFMPISGDNNLSIAAKKTLVIPHNATLVLPVCPMPDFMGGNRFFEWYHSRADGKNEVIVSLLPVKAAHMTLSFYFSLNLCLVAMRPLHNLRPFYIFIERIMQFHDKEAIMVNASDTLVLSRFLEAGYCGVDALFIENELKIKLVKKD